MKSVLMSHARAILYLTFLSFSLQASAMVTSADWNEAGLSIGADRVAILECLGAPDKVKGETEIYVFRNSPEVYAGFVEYKGEVVTAYGQIFKSQFTLAGVKKTMAAQGMIPQAESKTEIRYLSRVGTSDKECFILVTQSNDRSVGPQVKVTRDAPPELPGRKPERPFTKENGMPAAVASAPQALGNDDLKFFYGEVLLDVVHETKDSVMRLKGARWPADSDHEIGGLLGEKDFEWDGGTARFDPEGRMSDLFLDHNGRTNRGLSIGSPVSAIAELYPRSFTIQFAKFGTVYVFEFTGYGKSWALRFLMNPRTNQVSEIILRSQ